ncbi:unnamed protein product [Larinioides sclopetarius]|uniref:Uncharacterized protein n=1 Tax=Larinioides sclopetarius TaxID=280406 RepID=A0AAV2A1T2_9ARAC
MNSNEAHVLDLRDNVFEKWSEPCTFNCILNPSGEVGELLLFILGVVEFRHLQQRVFWSRSHPNSAKVVTETGEQTSLQLSFHLKKDNIIEQGHGVMQCSVLKTCATQVNCNRIGMVGTDGDAPGVENGLLSYL